MDTVTINGVDMSVTEWMRTLAADLDRDDVTPDEIESAGERADSLAAVFGTNPEAVLAYYYGAGSQSAASGLHMADTVHLAAAVLARRALTAAAGEGE